MMATDGWTRVIIVHPCCRLHARKPGLAAAGGGSTSAVPQRIFIDFRPESRNQEKPLPATYTIDEESAVVQVECFGVVTNQDMLDCLARLYSDPARKPGMSSLVDCRGVERMMVTPSGVQAAVMVKATMVDRRQPPWTVAVIAPQDEVFWMARTYEVLRAGSPETVRVFRQPAAAKRWLDTFKARSRPTRPKRSFTYP